MFPRPFLLALIGLVIGRVGGVASVAIAESSRDMILLESGSKHCYVGRPDLLRARVVSDVGEIDGISMTEVSTWTYPGGIYRYSDLLAWNPEGGVLLYRQVIKEFDVFYQVCFDPPRRVLPADLSVGLSWTNEYVATCSEQTSYCPPSLLGPFAESFSVVDHEWIQVPFGAFLAYEVLDDKGNRTWYAPGVGVVKYKPQDSVLDLASELVSTCPQGIAVESSTWGAVKARF